MKSVVLGLAVPAPPDNLLVMQILGLRGAETLGVGPRELRFNSLQHILMQDRV